MIGLYPLSNDTLLIETPESISSFLASISATIDTTLPNVLIPTPTLETPAYIFDASITATPGKVFKSGMATSTYSALLRSRSRNVTAIPTLTPSPTVATLILTDTSGHTVTTTSTASQRSITLGVPQGWQGNGALSRLSMSLDMKKVLCIVLAIVACALL